MHTRPGIAHGLDDAEAGDARRFPDDRNLARALHRAQRVDDRVEVLDLGLRRRGFQLGDEGGFPRITTVPGICRFAVHNRVGSPCD